MVPSRGAALKSPSLPSDLVKSVENGNYLNSQPLETVKMGDKDPCGLVPSRDATLESPSSVSNLVKSSVNVKFSSFLQLFSCSFYPSKSISTLLKRMIEKGKKFFLLSGKRGNGVSKTNGRRL